jgi:hypothetical protein
LLEKQSMRYHEKISRRPRGRWFESNRSCKKIKGAGSKA